MATQTNKRETVVTTEVDLANGALYIRFPRIDKMLQIVVAELNPTIIEQATFHGLKQKLIDAAAIGRNPDTGKSATDADKYMAVLEVYNRITGETPAWNAAREGGDGSASLLARALMRLYGKTRADIDAWLKTKSDDEKKALRLNKKVQDIIVTMQREALAESDLDTDAILDELASQP